jgi:hypothetical protein
MKQAYPQPFSSSSLHFDNSFCKAILKVVVQKPTDRGQLLPATLTYQSSSTQSKNSASTHMDLHQQNPQLHQAGAFLLLNSPRLTLQNPQPSPQHIKRNIQSGNTTISHLNQIPPQQQALLQKLSHYPSEPPKKTKYKTQLRTEEDKAECAIQSIQK